MARWVTHCEGHVSYCSMLFPCCPLFCFQFIFGTVILRGFPCPFSQSKILSVQQRLRGFSALAKFLASPRPLPLFSRSRNSGNNKMHHIAPREITSEAEKQIINRGALRNEGFFFLFPIMPNSRTDLDTRGIGAAGKTVFFEFSARRRGTTIAWRTMYRKTWERSPPFILDERATGAWEGRHDRWGDDPRPMQTNIHLKIK